MATQKRLTKREFDHALRRVDLSVDVTERVRRVLVGGERQVDVAASAGVGANSISTQVNRVWRAHLENQTLPAGMERVSVVLPADKAEIVRAWARDTENRRAER